MKLNSLVQIFLICFFMILALGFGFSFAQDEGAAAEAEEVEPAEAKATAPAPAVAKEAPVPPVAPSGPSPALAPAVEEKFGPSEPFVEEPYVPPSSESVASPTEPSVLQEELIYLNATDVEVKDLIKQISKATGTNFLIDDKIKGKITIISEKPMTKDMAYQAFLSALEVMGYTPVTTPGGLIKIVQTKESINKPLELYKDETPLTDKYITRILQLKNISANELSSVVKSLVSKDGNLFAYPATNSLILTDSGSNIDRILKIIKELDQEGPQEVIEIIPIKFADAKDITEKITALFEEAAAKTSRTAARTPVRRGAETPTQLEEAPSISKVITDERTNSVIILGSKRSIIKVKSLIARLDSPIEGVEGAIHVYYLKHANAKEMAEVLSSLVSDTGKKTATTAKKISPVTGTAAPESPAASAPGLSAASVQLEGEVKITADEGTNALVITASAKDFQTLVDRVLSKLDIPRRQVYLEAVVMELSVSKNKTIGVSGNLGNVFSLFGENVTGFGAVLPTFTNEITSLATASGGIAGGIASDRTVSFTDSTGNTIEIPAVSAILHALQSDSDVNILSTPSILTLDNQEAEIQVGAEVPVNSGQTIGTAGTTSFNVTREDIGIILKITPQVSESNTVRLDILQEITDVVPGTDASTLGPSFTKRQVKTVVVANDKQTIVIGGLIDDSTTVTTNKVPLLGDIPVLGNFFRNRATTKEKQNILVFVTPYIIRERADYLSILKKKIEERNLFIDMNYGASQRKAIRESIKNHAKELLEYKTAVNQVVGGDTYQYTPTTTTTATPSQVTTTSPPADTSTPQVTPASEETKTTKESEERVRYRQKSR